MIPAAIMHIAWVNWLAIRKGSAPAVEMRTKFVVLEGIVKLGHARQRISANPRFAMRRDPVSHAARVVNHAVKGELAVAALIAMWTISVCSVDTRKTQHAKMVSVLDG